MPDTTPIKEEARRLVDELPEDATWSEFARLVVERQRVEDGIADLDAGITWTSDEIRNKLETPQDPEERVTSAFAPVRRVMLQCIT